MSHTDPPATLYDALAAHLIATIDHYYVVDPSISLDPRYVSGEAQTAPTTIVEMAILAGWLHVEIAVTGWAESHTFQIELPTLTREDGTSA